MGKTTEVDADRKIIWGRISGQNPFHRVISNIMRYPETSSMLCCRLYNMLFLFLSVCVCVWVGVFGCVCVCVCVCVCGWVVEPLGYDHPSTHPKNHAKVGSSKGRGRASTRYVSSRIPLLTSLEWVDGWKDGGVEAKSWKLRNLFVETRQPPLNFLSTRVQYSSSGQSSAVNPRGRLWPKLWKILATCLVLLISLC